MTTGKRRGLVSSAPTSAADLTRLCAEYLEFIARFMARFGRSPAESDIQRHFLVSAPSVNQMVRTLEQRGFISRGYNMFTGQAASRSIRILIEI